ncbi:hypothetical protein ACHHRT_12675 [Desulfurivibrio sp. D14AmB]|uniref:cobaltochelatase CobT-related protein n=1 Tax=Desulfurivibrio sp. D14AmB TaxID=3374370 RepID=UPI00376F2A58
MKKNNLIGGLRIAMQALAGKFGIGLTFSGNTPFTDFKRINLPVLDHVDDEGVAIMARGYIDHEAAHIRFSDPISYPTWLNILEDVRIENAMTREYPGAGINLSKLVARIKQDDDTAFLGEREQPVSVLQSWALCWGRSQILKQDLADYAGRMEALALELFGTSFCTAFMGILQKLPGCRSTGDCQKLVEEIEELLRQNSPPPPPQPQAGEDDDQKQEQDGQSDESGQDSQGESQGGQDGKDDGDNGQNDQNSNDDDAGDDDGPGEEGDQEDPQGEGEQEGQGDGNDDQGVQSGNQGDQGESSDDPDGHDDLGDRFDIGQMLRNRLQQAVEDSSAPAIPAASIYSDNNDPVIANTFYGEMDWSGMDRRLEDEYQRAVDLGRLNLALLHETRRQTAQLRAGLDGLLQSVRLQHGRRVSSGQRVSSSDCYLIGAKTTDTRVFRSKIPRVDNNTAVAVLVDSSGSMQGDRDKIAASATYVITQALEAINGIETIVGHFPAAWTNEHDMRGVHVIKDFGEKPKMERFAFPSCGATPIRPALLWGGMQLCHRPEPRKVLLVITDGEVSHPEAVREIVKKVQRSGVEVYGIGIEIVTATDWLPPGNGVNIKDVLELPQAMIGLLKQALVQPGRR